MEQRKTKSKWVTVGTMSLKKPKEGSSKKEYNFLVKEDITLKKGQYLTVQDPRETVKRLLEKGILTEEQAEERLAKIPDWVRFEFVLAPARD